jgi:hypothetical protein
MLVIFKKVNMKVEVEMDICLLCREMIVYFINVMLRTVGIIMILRK